MPEPIPKKSKVADLIREMEEQDAQNKREAETAFFAKTKELTPKCIVCGRPRWETRLHCGDDGCSRIVHTMSSDELNNIRLSEALAAWRGAEAGSFYIHFNPREDDGQQTA